MNGSADAGMVIHRTVKSPDRSASSIVRRNPSLVPPDVAGLPLLPSDRYNRFGPVHGTKPPHGVGPQEYIDGTFTKPIAPLEAVQSQEEVCDDALLLRMLRRSGTALALHLDHPQT